MICKIKFEKMKKWYLREYNNEDTTIDILNSKIIEIEKSKDDAYKELELIREKNQEEFKKKQSEFIKMQVK